jgi:hypothetical protein
VKILSLFERRQSDVFLKPQRGEIL